VRRGLARALRSDVGGARARCVRARRDPVRAHHRRCLARPTDDLEGSTMNIRKYSIVAATLLALMAFLTAGAAANGQVEPFVAFDPAAGEFPESITTDKTGDLYVSMFVLDQVRRIDPTGAQTVVARLPRGATPAGVKLDVSGTLYVAA